MSDNRFTELRSPRLLLRRLQRDDQALLASYRSLSEVSRYQSWETYGLEEAAQLIQDQTNHEPNIPGTWFQMAIVVAATGTMIGDCGLHCHLEDPRIMELGITLAPHHQGHGYATETLECLLNYVFGELGKHRLQALTDAENLRVARLLSRLGFRQEAHLVEYVWFKGKWASEMVFAMLRREWQARTQKDPRGATGIPPSPS